MQLFFSPHIDQNNSFYDFDKDESRHIIKVLRKRVGDEIYITNGLGVLLKAKLTNSNLKQCTVEIISHEVSQKRPYGLHIAIAPTKNNDRFEWFLEKATEIGIDEITPLICEHSARKHLKLERFEKIIQAAMKQSLQCFLPKLHTPVKFQDFINQEHSGLKYIAHCYDFERTALKNRIKPRQKSLVLIGPEGDFSVKEIETALSQHYIPITLSQSRLRTETAGVVACHTVALINE